MPLSSETMPISPALEQEALRPFQHSAGVCPTEQGEAAGPDGGAGVSSLRIFASDGPSNCLEELDTADQGSEGSRKNDVGSVSKSWPRGQPRGC